jgi:RNA polymerase sigma-70 factor (ECF subfamily)
VRADAAEDAADRAVVDAFFAAAGSGDPSALLAVLAPDAELRALTPDGVTLVQGANRIATQAQSGARRGAAQRRPITVGGAAGAVIVIDGQPTSVIVFTVREGLIAGILIVPVRVR